MAAALLPSAGGAAMAKSLVSRILGVYKIAKVRPSTRSALVRPLCVSATSRGVGKYTGIQEIILTKDKAQDLICRLLPEERQILMDELSLHVGATGTRKTAVFVDQGQHTSGLQETSDAEAARPTAEQLRMMAIHNALPFVGFGFLDNFIMIVAGDYIDTTIGIGLGISTMAAAGLGNAISDAAGIGSAWYVEKLAVKIGVQAPGLTPAQLEMAATRWSANIGRAVGVFVGCILGMFPLLFLSSKEDVRQRHEKPS
uniref:Putative conserved plasma membrane protein n=2 Tax=Ixodes ricinus TaxID=34613 RepID=V5H2X7_IXORI